MQATIQTNAPRSSNRLAGWAERHPEGFGFTIFFGILILSIVTRLLLTPLADLVSVDVLNVLASVIVSLLAALLTGAMGWWRETGFRAPSPWRSLTVLWVPALMIGSLYGGIHIAGSATWLIVIASAVLTGFLEEILFRGLVMRAFLPGGAARAAVASSLFFSSMHLFNLIDGAPLADTLIQIGIALTTGILLAALTLRTRSIWPAILYHTLHDLMIWMGQGGMAMADEPSLHWKVIMLAGQAVGLVYGIILLWGLRRRKEEA